MKKIIKLTLGLLLAVCSACSQENGNALVLVFNEEQLVDLWKRDMLNTFGSVISDIKVSKQRNAYKYTVLFEEQPTQIAQEVFANSSSLVSVNIPNSVTKIGSWAFGGCSSLTSVTIPNSVTEIEINPFYTCSSLKKFKGKNVSADGRCWIVDGELIAIAEAGLSEYRIPDSVTKIGEAAFRGCTSLTSVTIPDSVTEIGSKAFHNCTSLTSVTISNSVTEIGKGAFVGCTSLTSVTIPNSVTEIGSEIFWGCSSLASVTIPDSVTKIGSATFNGCTSLTSVNLPTGVELWSNTFPKHTKIEYR